jgi:YfiH family protein
VTFTGRAEGDLKATTAPSVTDLPWHTVRQVHGNAVAVVSSPMPGPVLDADAMVTTVHHAALAIRVADCAPVALASAEGVIGAVHAGWRGLLAGVIHETARAMRSLGATGIEAALGPCIHAECYDFSPNDLDRIAARFGDTVRGGTSRGKPALDIPAAVDVALAEADVALTWKVDACTACEADRWYSHRARRDPERQALVMWL